MIKDKVAFGHKKMNILYHDVICYKNKKYNKKVTIKQLTNYHFLIKVKKVEVNNSTVIKLQSCLSK